MSAAAQLHADVTDPNDPHRITVLLVEERRGTCLNRLADIHLTGRDRIICHDKVVDDRFDTPQLFVCHGGKMGKVKTQTVLRHQRTGLFDMIAQNLSESGLQQMRRGMIAAGGIPLRT